MTYSEQPQPSDENRSDLLDYPLQQRPGAKWCFKRVLSVWTLHGLLLLKPAHNARRFRRRRRHHAPRRRRIQAHAPAAQVGDEQPLADRAEAVRDVQPDEPERDRRDPDARAHARVRVQLPEVRGGEDARARGVDEVDPLQADVFDGGLKEGVERGWCGGGRGRRGVERAVGCGGHGLVCRSLEPRVGVGCGTDTER